MSVIVFVRHGETVGQSSIRLYGATDIALSDEGREQMRHVATQLKHRTFDRLVVSPLSRSQESAMIATVNHSLNPVVIEAFREINFGSWEGWTLEEAKERDPANYAEYIGANPDFEYPGGGDTRPGFRNRVQGAIPSVFPPDGKTTLAVLHKGIIKALLGGLLGMTYTEYIQLECDLGSVHEIHHINGRWQFANDSST